MLKENFSITKDIKNTSKRKCLIFKKRNLANTKFCVLNDAKFPAFYYVCTFPLKAKFFLNKTKEGSCLNFSTG